LASSLEAFASLQVLFAQLNNVCAKNIIILRRGCYVFAYFMYNKISCVAP